MRMSTDGAIVDPETWRDIEARAVEPGALNARRLADAGGAVVAVDYQRRRHILLPLSSLDDGFSDSRSRGLLILPRMLEVEDAPATPFLDLCSTDPSSRDAFDVIANDLVTRLAKGMTAAEAASAVLAKWRRFWSIAPAEGLTPEEIRGLFGELWFVLVWLFPHGVDQVRHWVGPLGARHDFQWDGLSVEAKATNSVRGHIHRINGIDQLDPPESGQLMLYSVRLREEIAAANSLLTLVEGITNQLQNSAELLGLFEDRLAAANYSPLHAERYREIHFRIIDERLYRVADDFPRLSAASFVQGVPPGIERIEYEVNLETCQHLIVSTRATAFSGPP